MPPASSSSSPLLSSQRSRRTKNTSSSDPQAVLHRMKSQQGPKKSSNGSANRSEKAVTYGECQKNHAASIGGYAVDGCREFMAAGAEGTADALRCAACGCHRSFHKRKVKPEPEPACDCSSDSTSSWR